MYDPFVLCLGKAGYKYKKENNVKKKEKKKIGKTWHVDSII